jgi:ABC-type transport system involved in multi-copper enzyme maturation permease subunit
MSLVRAERRRLHKRRLTKVMLLLGAVILSVIAVAIWFNTEKITPETRAAATVRAQQAYQDQQRHWEAQEKAACERMVKEQGTPVEQECRGPQPEDFQAESFLRSTFDFRSGFRGMILVWAMIMSFVALIVGASYVGAEWSSGGMMNLLTWRPKRGSVLLTKLLALTGVAAFWSVVVLVLWTAALWAIASFHGSTAGLTAGTWQSFGLMMLRGLLLITAAAAFGFALASLGRRTAVAMGVLIALIVITQFGLTIVLFMAHVRFPEQFFIGSHLTAWMDGQQTLYDHASCEYSMGSCEPATMVLTWQKSGAIFGMALLAMIGASVWQIRSRDVD